MQKTTYKTNTKMVTDIKVDEKNLSIFLEKLITLYRDTFRQPPYLEDFSEEEAKKIITEYAKNGILSVRHDGKEIVGVICAEFNKKFTSEVDAQLKAEGGINLIKDVYISDLIVNPKFRRQGHATSLVKKFVDDHHHNKNIYLRTAVKDNDNVIGLYRKLEFVSIGHVRQNVENVRIGGIIDTDERFFMMLPQQVVSPIREKERRNSGYESFYDGNHPESKEYLH